MGGHQTIAYVERRSGEDRRARRVSMWLPERRTGFDRRGSHLGFRAWYERVLAAYRSNTNALLLVLIVIVALNVADLLFTVRALRLGATEVNPIMAWFLERDPVLAALYKLSIGGGVTLLLFAMRRYRRVLEASLLIVAVFAALFVYHLLGSMTLQA